MGCQNKAADSRASSHPAAHSDGSRACWRERSLLTIERDCLGAGFSSQSNLR